MSCHCACLKGNEIKVIMTPGGGGSSSVSIVDAYIVANKQSEEDYGYKKFNFYTYGKDGFMLSYKTRFSV